MQERASGLDLGWDRSFFVGEDCDGLGAIDFGVVFPFDLPLVLEPFPFPFLPFWASYSSKWLIGLQTTLQQSSKKAQFLKNELKKSSNFFGPKTGLDEMNDGVWKTYCSQVFSHQIFQLQFCPFPPVWV